MAIYYSILQGERYFRNEDASVISFRKFNQRPEDIYPDFTFCIENGIFGPRIKELGMNKDNFSNILKGKGLLDPTNESINGTVIHMDPKSYFRNLDDIVKSFTIRTDINTTSIETSNLKSFFLATHNDPKTQCFTRHSILERGSNIRRREEKLKIFVGLPDNAELDITFKMFVHMPLQLIRNIKSSVVDHAFSPTHQGVKSGAITLTIPSLTVLRRRSTNSAPCIKENNDDSFVARNRIIEKIKCYPMYWKTFIDENSQIEVCKTANELQKVYKNIQTMDHVLLMDTQPCNSMLIPLSIRKDINDSDFAGIDLTILYPTSEYQEIVNVRDFDFNSMFSGIGGFVGIFLGYSLLQTTDLMKSKSFKLLVRFYLTSMIPLTIPFTSALKKGKMRK